MGDLLKLARGLGFVASDLESRGYQYAGGVQQAARYLLDLAIQQEPDTGADGCLGCGDHLTQPATGRRRSWCSEACRSRARRR